MDWELPDPRLNIRADFCFRALKSNPDLSFPDIFPKSRDQVGFYRFINNKNFSWEDLYSDIEAATFDKADSEGVCLAIHDTTEVHLRNKSQMIPEFAANAKQTRPGFLAHISLLSSMNGKPSEVFGVAGLTVWSRGRGVEEHPRWYRHVAHVESLREKGSTIHLMDREGDSFEILHQMTENDCRFVVRIGGNRCLANEGKKLFEVMENSEVQCRREVFLSKRAKSILKKREKTHPGRNPRKAELSLSAVEVEFNKPKYKPKYKDSPDKISLNVVRVLEQNPPEGEKPVEWFLATTEPINSSEDIEKIVDYYTRRWLIEEFFKALKTGCRLENRLLESAESWLKVLALFLPIASNLLNIRLASDKPLQKSQLFTSKEKDILLRQAQRFKLPLETETNARDVIAAIGGYTKSRYPPGWQILARGYEKLRTWAQGAEMLTF